MNESDRHISAGDHSAQEVIRNLQEEVRCLTRENQLLAAKEREAVTYIRSKINQLLQVIGTVPLKPDELDDDTLLHLDPIGIISDTFAQILDHLRETNLELEKARDDIRTIFDSVGEGILVLDSQGVIIAHNRKMKEIFVDNVGDTLGKTCGEVLCEGPAGGEDCLSLKVKALNKSVRISSWQCRDRFYEIVGSPVFNKAGELQRVVILYMDITRRKKTELALAESEDRYRDLFENASDILQSVAPDGTILVVNKTWRDTLGYDEEDIRNLNIFDIIHPDYGEKCRGNFARILEEGDEFSSQTVLLAKDGREITVEGKVNCKCVDGVPVALRCIFRDITEKLRIEEELRRTQKLEAVGLLAGGIAHDFNNLLTAVIGNVTLAKLKATDRDLTALLENTEKASYRAQELTRQLLTFAKGGAPVKETASILEIIREVCSFALSGSKSKLSIKADEDISPVEVDPGQLSQVLQNLVINSDQAMPMGGEISIRVTETSLEENTSLPISPGRYVKIDIRDQGIGMPREHLSRIFDPYFSTKKKGSGLGLTTAYSIIRNHNGLITVDSKQGSGSGTTMTIYLPASKKNITRRRTAQAKNSYAGQGRILIMDDDEIVRQVATQMLHHFGYEVAEAAHGEEAVGLYRKARDEGHPFDLVILDLTVPGKMGGRETVAKLREIDPEVKAIVSSGYSHDPIMARYQEYGFAGVVPKPYSMEKMGAVVHSILRADR